MNNILVGGGQLNAINLVRELKANGHNVVILAGRTGSLESYIRDLGLKLMVETPVTKHPNWITIRNLIRIVKELRIEMFHDFVADVPAAIEAHITGLLTGVRVLHSYHGNWIPNYPIYYPKISKLTTTAQYLIDDLSDYGWPQEKLIRWWARIRLDEETNAGNMKESEGQILFQPSSVKLVIANRIDLNWNLGYQQMLLNSIELIHNRRPNLPIQLLIVGDGPARSILEAHAAGLNKQKRYPIILFAGQLLDPLPAYQLADVVIGRSSSLLRAMSLGKPCVAIGNGWARLVCPENLDELEYFQYWRNTPQNSQAVKELADTLEKLIDKPTLRSDLGAFVRRIIVERYDIKEGARKMEGIYQGLAKDSLYPNRRQQLIELTRSLISVTYHRGKRYVGKYINWEPSKITPSRFGSPYDDPCAKA